MSEYRTRHEPYGSGVFRRELHVEIDAGRARCELIDDFHHFCAVVEHDGTRITKIGGEAPRHPWATCPAAVARLQDLQGQPLAPSMRSPSAHTNARSQCTHLFDAACLAIARAGRGAPSVVYQMAVPDRVDGRTVPTLARDGEPFLAWELDQFTLMAPERYAGRATMGGFAEWAEQSFDPEEAEAAMLLQRACVFSGGRYFEIERAARADRVEPRPMGACHTYTPGTVEHADRRYGSVRNLTHVRDVRAASLAPLPPEDREPIEPA